MIELLGWLGQDIVLPLWAFVVALLLPAAFFARIAKETIRRRLKALE